MASFTYKIPMTTEAANLKLRRVSSSKQNFPGEGKGYICLKANTLRGRGSKILSSPYRFGYTMAKVVLRPLPILIVQAALKDFFTSF